MRSILSDFSLDGLDQRQRDEAIDNILELITDQVGIDRDAVSVIAAEFYEECLAADGIKTDAQLLDDPRDDPEFMREFQKWRGESKDLMSGSIAQAANRIANWADSQVRSAASETVIKSAEHDSSRLGREIRYARVPESGKSCGYCLTLAAYGFELRTYKSIGKIDKVHTNCKCEAVAFGSEDSVVEGYNPEIIDANMQKCADALGYGDWHECNANQLKEIQKEAETRDSEWFQTNKAPSQNYYKPRSEFAIEDEQGNIIEAFRDWRDLKAHDILQQHGFEINVRAENAPKGYANIDLDINGQLWEIKSPEGAGKTQAKNQFARAKDQFSRQYRTNDPVRIVYNGYYSAKDDDAIESDIRKRMRTMGGIHEVIQIRKDGSIRRIKSE